MHKYFGERATEEIVVITFAQAMQTSNVDMAQQLDLQLTMKQICLPFSAAMHHMCIATQHDSSNQ